VHLPEEVPAKCVCRERLVPLNGIRTKIVKARKKKVKKNQTRYSSGSTDPQSSTTN